MSLTSIVARTLNPYVRPTTLLKHARIEKSVLPTNQMHGPRVMLSFRPFRYPVSLPLDESRHPVFRVNSLSLARPV
jgi:hypothetical protein